MAAIFCRFDLSNSLCNWPRHNSCKTPWRIVTTSQTVNIVVDDATVFSRVSNPEVLGDDTAYPFYLNPPQDRVASWCAISGAERSLTFERYDFELLRPKSLDLEKGRARFGVWPASAGVLSLQQGRNREVWVRVALSDNGAPENSKASSARIAQLCDVWRAQLPSESYAATSFFDQSRVLPFQPGRHLRFERWLGGMSEKLNSVATFFDLGDTPDSHYKSTYIKHGRCQLLHGDQNAPRYFLTYYGNPASSTLNAREDFEPIWVNNEYDVIFAIGTEYLRTGDLMLLRKLRWFARHTIDVDFLHYSDHKWLHRAQPAHSARHTTTGAYPSHFWTQGLAQYYMLTGDPDALEVIIELADKTIENFDDPVIGALCHGLNREAGWGVLSLVCAYEASGEKRFDDYARGLLEKEMSVGLPDDIATFRFGHTSILLGARQYLQVHGGEARTQTVRDWFLAFVDRAIECSRVAPQRGNDSRSAKLSYDNVNAARGMGFTRAARSGIFYPASIALDSLAYAYEISGDKRYIEAGLLSLESMIDSDWFTAPVAEGKPYAMLYRTWINYFKAASALGYLEQWEYKYINR